MDGFDTNKKYESFKIQGRQQVQGDKGANVLPQVKSAEPVSFEQGSFYEIEYDSCPIPGVGKFVLKPQKIEEPEKDEKRELFGQMRDIARSHRLTYDNSKFYDRRVQQDNAIIFYKQGVFMKDFSDDYAEDVQFSQYFPYYQQMGYEQLRTYFTWRTEVRKGHVADTSLSYVFLYIYELLGNIGVSDPQEGLNQLMSFWTAYSSYNKSIDKYVLRWLKDYHIYYQLPHSFKDFIDNNNLTKYYPTLTNIDDKFNLLCNLSKYDIRKSTFFTEDNEKLIMDCFYLVIDKLKLIFEENKIDFEESIFQATKKLTEWKPFKDALFYPWLKQADRRIVLSEHEIFICSKNQWSYSTVLTSEHGRQLIGYIMKQMEVALRKATNYKFKLSANIDMVAHEVVGKLTKAGLSLEMIINNTVTEFYKEETKTVVTVDQVALSRIRQEALVTQEKLIVPEQEKLIISEQEKLLVTEQEKMIVTEQLTLSFEDLQDMPSKPQLEIKSLPELKPLSEIKSLPKIEPLSKAEPPSEIEPVPIHNAWESLKDTLTEIELNALAVVLHDGTELKKYANECNIMLEVLVDGINEKAMDFIGDNLLDEEFILYDDYKEQVKEWIG